jgi:5-methylcytosine-specific restriction endonuclease McrBC regulatory subunit McrC
VSFEIIRDSHFDTVEGRYTRLNEHYKPLIRVSRILIENISLNLQMQGKLGFWSFLVDMNKLFQRFVTFCLQGLRDFDVGVEPIYKWDLEGLTTIKPDMVIRKGKDVKLVVDAKYKHISLDKKEVYGDDVRQVGDYCTTLGLERGVLVYPKLSSDQKVYDLPIRKREPITNRSYNVLLKTIDLFSTDLLKFKSACNDFLADINEILCSESINRTN